MEKCLLMFLLLSFYDGINCAFQFIPPSVIRVNNASSPKLVAMFLRKDSVFRLRFDCASDNTDFSASFVLRRFKCANDFMILSEKGDLSSVLEHPGLCHIVDECKSPTEYMNLSSAKLTCSHGDDTVQFPWTADDFVVTTIRADAKKTKGEPLKVKHLTDLVGQTWSDGLYLLAFSFNSSLNQPYTLEIVGSHGYLGLDQYSLMKSYAFFCAFYLIIGIAWLYVCARHWKELMRIQTFIGIVIGIAIIEYIVYAAAYAEFNRRGLAVDTRLTVSLVLGCGKLALARGVIILASYGFGMIKPRIGSIYRKVYLITISYFFASLIEEKYHSSISGPHKLDIVSFLAVFPVSIINSIICVWVFTSLLKTIKNLRAKRNEVKLQIYRHFTYVLIITVLACHVLWLFTMVQPKYGCIEGTWFASFETTCWNGIVTFLLVSIAIIWRPSANNRRYAYFPLLDTLDNDGDEIILQGEDIEDDIRMRIQPPKEEKPKQVHTEILANRTEKVMETFDFEEKADKLIDEITKMH